MYGLNVMESHVWSKCYVVVCMVYMLCSRMYNLNVMESYV
jgi:hypothetical protein